MPISNLDLYDVYVSNQNLPVCDSKVCIEYSPNSAKQYNLASRGHGVYII